MLLIKNGKILTMTGQSYDSGSILIKDTKIVEVNDEIHEENYAISKVIDATGCWVLPGLIDAHCHIGITEEKKGFEGDDCNEMKDPITPYIRGLDAINPMDSAFHNAAALLREELLLAREYQQEKLESEKQHTPFKIDFRKECWLPVLERKIPLKAHAHRADDILTAIRIANEFDLLLTLDHCTEGHLVTEEIRESGFPANIGPTLASRNKIEVQYMDFKTAGILHEAGIKVAIISDHPVTRIQYLPICAGFAAKEGLGIAEGLKAITINAAEICNVSHRVGSIQVGKDADIAIFNGNPMETFTTTMYTIIDGEIVYDYKKSRLHEATAYWVLIRFNNLSIYT